ncbi:unnamed protein product [Closterium sp. NIES-53]
MLPVIALLFYPLPSLPPLSTLPHFPPSSGFPPLSPSDSRLYLSLRLADSSCEWSGAFRPSQLGDTQLKLRCSLSPSSPSSPLALTRIVRVDVSLAEPHLPQAAAPAAAAATHTASAASNDAAAGTATNSTGSGSNSGGNSGSTEAENFGSGGGSGAGSSRGGDGSGKWSGGGTYLVVIGEDDSGFMPFRIDNCCREVLRFYQRGCEGLGHTDSLKPFAATPYAWDEPCRPHRLVLEVPGEGGSMGHFPLDQVKHFPLVVLPATPQREQRRLRVSVSAQGPIRVLSVCDIDLFPPPSSLPPLRLKHLPMPRHAELAFGQQHHQPWNLSSKSPTVPQSSSSSLLELLLSVHIPLIALSVIDARPQELLLLSLHRLSVSLSRSAHQHSLSFLLSHLQLDNQLPNALFPILLASSSPPLSLTRSTPPPFSSPSPSPFSMLHPSHTSPSLALLQAALQTPSLLLSSVLHHTAQQQHQAPSHSALLQAPFQASLQGGQAAVAADVVAWRQRVGSVLCAESVRVGLAPLSLELEEHLLLRLLDFSRTCIAALSALGPPSPSSSPHSSSLASSSKGVGRGWAGNAGREREQEREGARGSPGAQAGRGGGDGEQREEGRQQGQEQLQRVYVWCSGASVAAVGVVGGPGMDTSPHIKGTANMYIETMVILPIHITISFASAPWAADQSRGAAAQGLLGALGAVVQRSVLSLADVQGAPLGLSAWQLEHFFGGPASLGARLERHYTLQLLQALYKVRPVSSSNLKSAPAGISPVSSALAGISPVIFAPAGISPARSAPAGILLVSFAPVGISPLRSAPAGISPVSYAPAGISPVSSAPADISPVSSAPAGISPVRSSPAGISPVRSAPAGISPVRSAPAGISPVRSAPAGISPVISSPAGISPVRSAPAGISPVRSAPAGISPVSSSPAGISPVRSAPAGISPVRSAPTGISPVISSPAGISPIRSAPAGISPVRSAPAGISPVSSAPAGISPVSSAPAGISPVRSTPAGISPVNSAPAVISPVRSAPTGVSHLPHTSAPPSPPFPPPSPSLPPPTDHPALLPLPPSPPPPTGHSALLPLPPSPSLSSPSPPPLSSSSSRTSSSSGSSGSISRSSSSSCILPSPSPSSSPSPPPSSAAAAAAAAEEVRNGSSGSGRRSAAAAAATAGGVQQQQQQQQQQHQQQQEEECSNSSSSNSSSSNPPLAAAGPPAVALPLTAAGPPAVAHHGCYPPCPCPPSSLDQCYPSPLPHAHFDPPLLPPCSPLPTHPLPPSPAAAFSAASAAAATVSPATAATVSPAAATTAAAMLPAAAAAATTVSPAAAATALPQQQPQRQQCLQQQQRPQFLQPQQPQQKQSFQQQQQPQFLQQQPQRRQCFQQQHLPLYPPSLHETSLQYSASPPSPSSRTLDFVLDSGATETALKDAGTLTPLPLPTQVHGADSSISIPCTHLSTLPCTAFPSGTVTGLHIPTLRNNLLSHRELQGVGITAIYPGFASYCDLYHTASGRFLMCIPLCPRTRLHTLRTPRPSFYHVTTRAGTSTGPLPPPPLVSSSSTPSPSSSPTSSPALSPSSTTLSHLAVLLHHRLGHPNFTALRSSVTSRLLNSLPPTLPPLPSSPAPPCPSCIHGKLKQSSHHSHPTFTAAPIALVHMDLWGPYPIRSCQGHQYMLVLVVDHSWYSSVFFLHTKDQNRIREITKIARYLIAHASTPPSLWSYALLHAALLLNLCSHPRHPSSSPTELWSQAKPDIASLRVWGCKAFVLIPPADRSCAAGKLAPRALECVYLGHNRDSPGYPFLHPPTNRLIRGIDVIFDESIPYYSTSPPDPLPPPTRPLAWTDTVLPPLLPPAPLLPPVAAPLPPSSSADVYDPAAPASPAHSAAPPPSSPSSSNSPPFPQQLQQLQQQPDQQQGQQHPQRPGQQQQQQQPGQQQQQQQQGQQQQGQQQQGQQHQQQPGQQQQQQQQPGQQHQQRPGQQQQQQQPQPGQHQQQRRATSRSSPFLLPHMHTRSVDKILGAPPPASIQLLEDSHEEFLNNPQHTPFLASLYLDFLGFPVLGATSTPTIFTPTTFQEAITCADADKWLATIFLECEAFIRNDSFVDQLPSEEPVYKARYCAKGFTQTWGEDFWFTYAPTAKPPTFRTALDIGARDNMEICSMDVSNAFLQGDLNERIFLRQPPRFHAAFPENTVWQLRRPVYGLKQAPREWHAKLSATLGSLGFSASHSDASPFIHSSPRRFFILVYVDDMILLSDSKDDMARMKLSL